MNVCGGFIIFASLIWFSNCVPYQDCGGVIAKVTNITVSNCDDSKTFCLLTRGTNATLEIEFHLISDTENDIKAICHGIIAGLPVPFKLPYPNACINSNLNCPLNKRNTYRYIATFPVLTSYPKVKVDVKFELKHGEKPGAGAEIACVVIPVEIQ